jgi:hypothetical protein
MREALEAESASPAPPSAAPRPRPAAGEDAREGPRLTPSPELEAVLREALEAESATSPSPGPAPRPRPAAREPARDAGREGPRVAPSPELEAAMRAALEAEAAPSPPAAPPGKTPARPGRGAPTRIDVGDTVKEALRQQQLMKQGGVPMDAGVDRPTNAKMWIVVALISVAAGIGGGWYISTRPEPEPEVLAPRGAHAPGGATPASRSTGTLQDAVDALRALHAASGPTISLPTYQAKLATTQATVGQYLDSDAPTGMKQSVREILDLYVLAAAAWQARALDTAESWDSVSRSPSLGLCTAARQMAEAAERPGQNNAQPRGRAIAGAITQLWECAAGRLAQLEGGRAAR